MLLISTFHSTFSQTPQTLSLDGEWEIIFDDKNEGRSGNWMNSEVFLNHPNRQNIQVPSAWETIKQDYEGVGFYRKSFNVPEDWEDKVIRLQFDAVNYLSEVWINDEVVGFHEGGFTPFEFRVDEMIKPGEANVITLRVVGPLFLSDKEIDGMKALETPQWRGGLTGGIWQSVQLVATNEVYVKDVFIQPNINDNTATLEIELDHTAIKNTSVNLEVMISNADSEGQNVANLRHTWGLHPGKNKQSFTFKINDAIYWSPDNPHLYKAEVIVKKEKEISDQWSTRFGMRELIIKNKDFYLNGKRIHIKGSFFEGLYPNGIASPDNEAMARKEIRMAKEAGFNMIRPWRRPPVPMWLDLADEMGVLVVGSPALECMRLPFSTPYLPKRVENEVRESILRDRNRACIIQWELFNELHRPVLKQLMRPMAMLARTLDPTRLILDESGGWAFGANMYLPNDYEPTKFNDIHNYPGPFINKDRFDGYLSIGLTKEEKKAKGFKGKTPGLNVVPGLMSYVSELGYGSLPNLTTINQQFKEEGNPLTPAYRYHARLAKEQKVMLVESGFESLYPDMEQFYLDQQLIHGTANKRMLEAVRLNPEVDGYCIHALVAGDWILGAGLLDLWRNPKSYVYEGTKVANQPQILSIRVNPRNIYAEEGATLEILGVNELKTQPGSLAIEIKSKDGKSVFTRTVKKNWKEGISQLFKEKMSTQNWNGTYFIKVRMLAEDKSLITENTYDFDVFPASDLQISKAKIAVIDETGKLTSYLKKKGVRVSSFKKSTNLSIPVYITGTLKANEMDKDLMSDLLEFVKRGGTAVYIEGAIEDITDENDIFPFSAKVHPSVGLWTCIPHLVHDHPIFAGLPSDGPMRDIYENVWARKTLRNMAGGTDLKLKTTVASIGFDWFSKEHKMHYSGPGSSWWGSDLAEISLGKGRCIISQLRLVENLGTDPVADQILKNMILFTNKK